MLEILLMPWSYSFGNQLRNDYQVGEKNGSALVAQPLETKLDPRIAKFVSLICNIAMMKQYMMEIG